MLVYNCIGWGGWLSDVTDAAKDTVNKSKTNKSYEQERNKLIAEKITQILADIKNQLSAGNEIDVKSTFVTSLSNMRISIRIPFETKPRDSRLSEEEVNKFVAENQPTLDKMISEQEQLKQKAQKEREMQQQQLKQKAQREQEIKQEEKQKAQKEKESEKEPLKQTAFEHLIDRINYDNRKEELLRQYYHKLSEIYQVEIYNKEVSEGQFDNELKQRADKIKFTNVNKFDSKVNFYKDFSSGISYAWVFLLQDTRNERIVFDNKFNVTSSIMKDGANQLLLLFSNGDYLLPTTIFTKKDEEDGIAYDGKKIEAKSNDEVFGMYIIFEKSINIEEVLKKSEAKYGNFKSTTVKESIILSPLPYKTSFEYKTAIFENDNIKVEIQQLRYSGEKVEKIAKPSPDYDKWVSGLKTETRALEEILSGMYNITPSEKEIKEKIDGINSPVKMSIYDIKRLKKLYILYQEELNALNAKRQAKEKEAQDKDAQAKKDALSF